MKKRKPESGFLSEVVAPARHAIENEGITTLDKLARYSELEILRLHGMGRSTISKLRRALKVKGLKFMLR
ncbi:MAG: hypothetical protein ACRES3_01775 [Steroidobacteraceae bacterium]